MKKISLICLATLLAFQSCKKTETLTSEDQEIVEDNSHSEQISEDASKISDDAYYASSNILVRDNSSASAVLADTVKIIKNTSDSSITVDFGTNGITCRDGRVRYGKVMFKFTNGFRNAGKSVTQTFDGYKVDDRTINNSSTRTVTYNGTNASGQPYWTIVANMSIAKANGKVVTWNSTRKRTMTAGASTPLNWSDDVYEISGGASGVTGNGTSYTLTINKNLLIRIGCKYIQDGVITMTRGSVSYSIDYGTPTSSNNCDNQATFTMNGKSTVFTLR
jgi:hypothetical protein